MSKRYLQNDIDYTEYLRCPITKQIFVNPVVGSDGQTYERDALVRYLQTPNPISLKTGKPLNPKTMIPNLAIEAFMKSCRVVDF
jgi:hypothetical protein